MLRPLTLLIAVAILAPAAIAVVPGVGVTAAQAQETGQRKVNLFDLLFRRKKAAPQVQEVKPQRSTTRKSAPAAPRPAPAVETVEKSNDARVILVVGDFAAGGLAQGLQEAFAEAPLIRIVARTKGSSGFVRDDYYDWPASIGAILEEEKPALVVMMAGSNDRQAMRVDGHSEDVRSDAWDKEYAARLKRFAEAVKAYGAPLVWVGGPPFRFKSMSADILAFNEFYRNAAEAVGGVFVDIWDGFVDQNGAFIMSGSDVNGKTVRLRAPDGINFTSDGKRKLAFYVERQIRQKFGDSASPLLTMLAPESLSPMRLPPLHGGEELERFDPLPIADPAIDGGAALLGDVNAPNDAPPPAPLQAKNVRGRLVEDGVPPPSKPGRANDFTWTPAGG